MSSIAATSCSLRVPSSAVGVPSRVITRSISSSSSPVLAAASSRRDRRARVAREQVLDVAEREPPIADGPPQLLERVTALAHPRDDAGLGGGGRRPAAVLDRDHLRLRPALQRRRRDARRAGPPRSGRSFPRPRADPRGGSGSGCVTPEGASAPLQTATGSWGPVALRASRPASSAFGTSGALRASPPEPQSPGGSRRRDPLLACCHLSAGEPTPAGAARQCGVRHPFRRSIRPRRGPETRPR